MLPIPNRIMLRANIPVHLNYVSHAMEWEKPISQRQSVLRNVPTSPEDMPEFDSLLPRGVPDDKICRICTDPKEKWPVKHGHFSSEVFRRDSIANNQTNYFCPTCKKVHGVAPQQKRKKIVLSSSTLHNAISHLDVKNLIHMDVESIPGAKVWDMQRTFRRIYSKDPTPVDIVLVCGLNQIQSQSAGGVISSYRSIIQDVKEHSIKHKHVVPNTINIATLMYPPKFCSFRKSEDPAFPSYLNSKNNLVSKIDTINKGIMELNMAAIENKRGEHGADEMFCMHSYGIRHLGSGKEQVGKREHRWSAWFEKNDEKKLHLKHELRAQILHKIQSYFIHNTEW